jgi:hypothetical protein
MNMVDNEGSGGSCHGQTEVNLSSRNFTEGTEENHEKPHSQ